MFFHQRYQYYPFNSHLIGACCIETSACKEKPGFSHFSHTGLRTSYTEDRSDHHHTLSREQQPRQPLKLWRYTSPIMFAKTVQICGVEKMPCRQYVFLITYVNSKEAVQKSRMHCNVTIGKTMFAIRLWKLVKGASLVDVKPLITYHTRIFSTSSLQKTI